MDYNPASILRSIWGHRELLRQFIKREVTARYRGSYLGVIWSFLTPLLMLLVYTFLFGVVFSSKWASDASGSKAEFALILFCGISTFNLFSEVVSRAPSLIINNVNYVKKVVFPLEILPVVALGSALVNLFINLAVLMLGLIFLLGTFKWTIIFLPIVLLPLGLLALGLTWFLSSLGVYMRDIGQIIGIAVQALLFLSPIFYPVSSLPENIRTLFLLNPISYVVEDMRRIIIWGQMPDWNYLLIGLCISGIIAYLGFIWFQKTRGGFSDVL